MKKLTVFLISALTFLVGISSGIVIGIVLAPVKKGIDFKMSFNECWNTQKMGSKNEESYTDKPEEKIVSISKKRDRKGLGRWIGRK